MNSGSEIPQELRDALSARLDAGELSAPEVHRLKVALAELVLSGAQPDAIRQLEVARRFLDSIATPADLADARQDCWTQIGSLACYCGPTDSLTAQAILACLEAEESQHAPASLSEQVVRVLRCGAPGERVLGVLRK